jgi:hypothetical protein
VARRKGTGKGRGETPLQIPESGDPLRPVVTVWLPEQKQFHFQKKKKN